MGRAPLSIKTQSPRFWIRFERRRERSSAAALSRTGSGWNNDPRPPNDARCIFNGSPTSYSYRLIATCSCTWRLNVWEGHVRGSWRNWRGDTEEKLSCPTRGWRSRRGNKAANDAVSTRNSLRFAIESRENNPHWRTSYCFYYFLRVRYLTMEEENGSISFDYFLFKAKPGHLPIIYFFPVKL